MADYNWFSKGLHFLSLGQPMIAEAALDIELSTFGRKLSDVTMGHHVFVTGFPRSGTTILTRHLYDLGQFGSLTYRDMPFVLAPNCWSKVSKVSSKTMADRERIHGDGIYVGYDSPEAFDEVFWRISVDEDYIKKGKLTPHSCDSDLIEKFRKYVAAILYRYGKKCYLSKNNNNILRIGSIVEAFPNSYIVVPFRKPLAQSVSLLNQHKNILDIQQQDPFIERYMSWLGHHEFGRGHKTFDLTEKKSSYQDTQSIEYWLDQWQMTYSYLLGCYSEFNRHIIFICYEELCDDSFKVWESLLWKIQINNIQGRPEFRLGQSIALDSVDHDQLVAAENTYNDLCSLSCMTLNRSELTHNRTL
jgi:hypothetical protein